jgi:HlyD family secretion protein
MKKVFRIAIIVLIIAAAIIGYTIYKKKTGRPEWRLDTTSTGSIREVVTASGTLYPSTQVEVGTEISGKIAKIYKDFNSTVQKGDILAKLDTENLETALESSQADVRKAQLNADDTKIDLDLQKELNKKGMGTDYDLNKAQNKYDLALQNLANSRFSLRRAEKNLQNAIITSPIDGVIVSRKVEEGQTVAASMSSPTLFVIANNLHKMQINADIDEADIGRIRVGEQVEFKVDAFADDGFRGKVNQVRLSPNSTQNVVTYSVIIDVDNPQLKLLPGMTANVTIVVYEKEDVLRIPESALRFKPSKELWKQFGLKWDDNISGFGGRGRGSFGEAGTFAGTGHSPSGNTQAKRDGKKLPMSDSLKAKIAKMSPEQKAEFFKKMSAEGGRPDFSKMTEEQKQAFRNRRQQGAKGKEAASPESGGGQFVFEASSMENIKTIRNRVWVLENGIPKAIDVVTGLSDGNNAEVISGIKDGQEFITGVNYKNAKQAAKAGTSSAFSPGGFGGRH